MTQPTNIISLAAVRAARQAQAAAPAAPVASAPTAAPAPPQPLRWRESRLGNWWTKDPRNGIHFVIFQNRRDWSGRVTMPSGEAWFENMPGDVCSAEEAQAWAEEWLEARRVPSAVPAQERTIP